MNLRKNIGCIKSYFIFNSWVKSHNFTDSLWLGRKAKSAKKHFAYVGRKHSSHPAFCGSSPQARTNYAYTHFSRRVEGWVVLGTAVTVSATYTRLSHLHLRFVLLLHSIWRFNITGTIGDQLDGFTYLVACHCWNI